MSRGPSTPPLPVGPQYYTVAEVAGLLRASEDKVLRMIKSGHIPARLVGRTWRVPIRRLHEVFPELG